VRIEYALLGVVALALVAGVGVAVGVPDALDPPDDRPDEPERHAHVDIEELTIAAGAVGGEQATIRATPYVTQRGGDATNVTVVLRAVDQDTGFVAATDRLDYGTLAGGVEAARNGSLTVDRQGDYDVEAILYVNGTRVERGAREVSGVGSLTPAYRDTPVQFQEFDAGLPVIEYRIRDVEDGRSTLAVSTYLTNTGASATEGLELVLTARQNGSNVVADRTTVDVDAIGSGKTATPTGELEVPDDYNYYLDAVLWRDGTVVATARSTANLAPGTGLTVDENRSRGGEFRAGDFEREEAAGGEDASTEAADRATTVSSSGQPGFGVPVALLAAALVAVAIAARRHA